MDRRSFQKNGSRKQALAGHMISEMVTWMQMKIMKKQRSQVEYSKNLPTGVQPMTFQVPVGC